MTNTQQSMLDTFATTINTTHFVHYMGVPNFMEGSLISYEIGDPGVPKILGNWGPGFPISYENGDPGSPFWGGPGVPIFT